MIDFIFTPDDEEFLVDVPAIEMEPPCENSPSDQLRRINARVEMINTLDDTVHLGGRLSGLVTSAQWEVMDHDLADSGDRYDGDAADLGRVADELMDEFDEAIAALLLTRLTLDEKWRGYRLARELVRQVLEILGLLPQQTIVVFRPEPLTPDGPMELGSDRDVALARLCAANEEQGFKRWRSGPVWWLPLNASR
ncbi:hypothetical protein DEO23_12265 [Brachybacterium endophyticum]|uniref:Uncharacterized protein n=1 Tax=Brachybacterium endophyticum TaxID=2182385 RepID=A0A2U2RHN1_9MICO|nr:hypothetical protein [Brachybacterium endophyticum]PWH05360.1 hypothetical protein DEO23_12265 [Brachybacterium endophyticum]